MVILPVLTSGVSCGSDDSVKSLVKLTRSHRSVTAADVMVLLPHGVAEEHASRMMILLHDLDWEIFSLWEKSLVAEYMNRMVREYIAPIVNRLFALDERSVRQIMFPEDFLKSDPARFLRRYPDTSDFLWAEVSSYFCERFDGFSRNVHPVSALFHYCRGNLLEAVAQSSLTLMRYHMVEFARRGDYSGIVRCVRNIEAKVLAASLRACRN